jgi:Carboxypeptidase regulatory-like domain
MDSRTKFHRTAAVAAALLVASAGSARAQQPVGTAAGTIAGQVVDTLGMPANGVTVTVDTSHIRATTDSTGHFRLPDVPAGVHRLALQGIGYARAAFVVTLSPGGAIYQTLTVEREVVTLPAVKNSVVGAFGKPARLAYTTKYDGFYERRATAPTSGYFYTHEDLAKMREQDFADMLRLVPHLKVVMDPDGTVLRFPGCETQHILIMIDDQRVWPVGGSGNAPGGAVPMPSMGASGAKQPDAFEFLQNLHLDNVEAMEVYESHLDLPLDAVGPYCAAIMIWTR